MQFTPTHTFEDADLRSTYVEGLTYTVRARKPDPKIKGDEGTPLEKTLLYAKVQDWLAAGKVRLGAGTGSPDAQPTAGDSRVRGSGTVS